VGGQQDMGVGIGAVIKVRLEYTWLLAQFNEHQIG